MVERTHVPLYTVNKGSFIKPCPGTPGHVCCGYWILNVAQGCTLRCTYCILDRYFHNKKLVVFTNIEKLFQEIELQLRGFKGILRYGTGEFTDSLLLKELVPLYSELIPFISETRRAVIELKTKTTNVDTLLGIKKHDRAIVSWSVNSGFIAEREESFAPPVEERIRAACRALEAGYKVAFHFDPIIMHEGWEDGYRRTVEKIFEAVRPEHVVYISMGALRYKPDMNGIPTYGGEFIRTDDNKMRYFRPLRVKAYRALKSMLSQYVPEEILYLCMENSTVWEDVFDIRGMTSEKLSKRLDEACQAGFGCNP